MAPRFPLHAVSWVLYLVAVIWTLIEMRRQRWHTLLFVALWLAHSLVFYTVLIVRNFFYPGIEPFEEFFTWWANALAMHGGLAVLSILFGVRRYT